MDIDDTILTYLRTGAVLTPAIAAEKWKVLALHSSISRLRERGHQITCTMKSGNGRRYGSYKLESAAQANRGHPPPSNPEMDTSAAADPILVTTYGKDKDGKEYSFQYMAQ
jgi:hypothetical protein